MHEWNTAIIWRTYMFEWYVVRCESKYGHQKDIMCWQRAQMIMLTIRSSKIRMSGGTYMTTQWAREPSLWYWIRSSYELQDSQSKWRGVHFGFANHLALTVCFKTYDKSIQITHVYLTSVCHDLFFAILGKMFWAGVAMDGWNGRDFF